MTTSMIVVVVSVMAALSLVKSDSARHPTVKSGISWIHFGHAAKGIGIFGIGMVIYILVSRLMADRPGEALILGTVMAALAVPCSLHMFFWKVGYDDDGIYCRSPWRRRRYIPWRDVKGIRFAPVWKQWVVETGSSGTVRISVLTVGTRYAVQQWKRLYVRD